ncbi:Rpn family recombination-promoting nuclease/putative transposase [Nocardia puris]|uniref:Putative transposase/invertase (TIGR01784 family) n=1 Tax=Nocardia puris TaxID=208602 RepID=A0A366DJD3_9NOCA|nr:Rpn family recombination-promoting nuclease/putative transposase [Nocardia puris]RBO90141.1 putative transposase/invertase (TIGR01784 family) [Nocardia puris]
MAKPPPNPHDAYFRRVMSRPDNAASQLRAVLPSGLVARIDWSELKLCSTSLVSKELRSRYTDLVFSTRVDGHPAYLYVLMEHQSTSDRFMPVRMLEYVVGIWNQHRAETGSDTLPIVVPVVVHSNGASWNAPTQLSEMFDLDPDLHAELAPYIPTFQFLLDDVAELDLTVVGRRGLTADATIMLVLHKIAKGHPHLGEAILEWLDQLRSVIDLDAVFTYMLQVSETPETDFDPVIDRLGPEAKEALMTTAEQLRAEGEARGAARARAEMLIVLLAEKFGTLPNSAIERVRTADADRLHTWARRILTANTLHDALA